MHSSPPPTSRRSIVVPGLVLVTDDDPSIRLLTSRWLLKSDIGCIEASSGTEAVKIARERAEELDCIILDVMMPGFDGYQTLEQLKADPATADVPVVLLTATANAEEDLVKSAEAGAVDHLQKPFSGPVLVARVKAICERRRRARQVAKRLVFAEENATIDPLTRLFNRRHFLRRLQEETAHATRYKRPFAVVMIDLDHFKSVNDTFGHDGGDLVLSHVAGIARSIIRADDTAFRYGGEEFILLLRSCDANGARTLAERLRQELKQKPIDLAGTQYTVTFSSGIAAAEQANEFLANQIVTRADKALYRAKREGRDRTELADKRDE